MARITFGLNVFNEATFIEQSLGECYSAARQIVVVDGAYRAFPYHGDNGASDDGTLEIVRRFPDPARKIVLIEAQAPWESEMVKLNAYLACGGQGDWMFRVDPDERVRSDWASVQRQLDEAHEDVIGFSVPFVETGGNRYKWFRLLRWREDLRYRENHWRLFYGSDELVNYDARPDELPTPHGRFRFGLLSDLVLHHQEHSPEREALKRAYYQHPDMR